MTNYYDVLDVEKFASDKEIKDAARRQIRRFHPDKCDHPDAEKLVIDVQRAKRGLVGPGPRVSKPRSSHGPQPSNEDLKYQWEDGDPMKPVSHDSETGGNGSYGGTRDRGNDRDDEDVPAGDDGHGDDTPWDPSGYDGNDPNPDHKATANDSAGDGRGVGTESGARARSDRKVGVGGSNGPSSVSSKGPSAQGRESLRRRDIVLMAGVGGVGLLFANQLGWFGSDDEGDGDTEVSGSEEQEQEEYITVDPSGSIQDAIEQVSPGGTVEVTPGTYSEALTIERELTIEAPDGATLDGRDVEESVAVTVADVDFELSGFEVVEYDGVGVRTDSQDSEIVIADTELHNLGGKGLDIFADQVVAREVTVTDCGDTGIQIESTPGGDVDVTYVTVERSERGSSFGSDSSGRGLNIEGGKDITITKLEAIDNGGNNLRIHQGDSRGQAIEITDCTTLGAGSGSNIVIRGTSGEDEVTIADTTMNDGSSHGANVGSNERIESVTIKGTEAIANGDTGIRIESTPGGDVDVTDVTVERSERDTGFGGSGPQGHGLAVEGGEDIMVTELEATENGGTGCHVEAGGGRGQYIKIEDSIVNSSNNRNGIYTGSTDETDEHVIENVEANANSNYGLDLGGDSIVVDGTTAEDNGDGPYRFRNADDEDVTVTDSTDQVD